MNSKTIRRLATEHSQLHTNGLPPNYLWPQNDNANDGSDLAQLTVLLAGPESTPFSSGLFTLQISIPPTYPSTAPTATFKTKIFHPNVSDNGSVCVDTLKRDWKPELKIFDILVVINCLLISPNPASALNAEAGRLCESDFAAFERRAKTWVSIHASCPKDLLQAVREARQKGDPDTPQQVKRKTSDTQPVMKKSRATRNDSKAEPLASGTNNILGISNSDEESAVTKLDSLVEVCRTPEPVSTLTLSPSLPQLQHVKVFTAAPSFIDVTDAPLDRFPGSEERLANHKQDFASSTWSRWQASSSPTTVEESGLDRTKRRKLEERRLKAVGGCVKRYNSGAFGVRKGLRRL